MKNMKFNFKKQLVRLKSWCQMGGAVGLYVDAACPLTLAIPVKPSLQTNLGRPLTPSQWLPKPATSQFPQKSCALRATWSPDGGEGDTTSAFRQMAHSLWSVGLVMGLLALLAGPVGAQSSYLAKGRPDGIALLPPPPVLGSEEEAADLATVRAVFKARTPEETARAEKDATLSLFNFASVIGPEFQPGRFPKMEALFERVKTNITDSINAPKNCYKRLRPYQVDTNLTLGAPEPSPSYPSGHSSRGTVQALLLAELFPEKRAAILEFGREIGWDRVLIGKHFPTDVQAGRVMGRAIVRELMASPAFQRDLAEAKAEVQGRLEAENPVKK
jgi:acid phosphatase (class A)